MEHENKYIKMLGDKDKENRLSGLKELMKLSEKENVYAPKGRDVNNHIHTIYSFSPYSPSEAVYRSLKAGLVTTGIMDHDSVSGADEFIKAGQICTMPVTVGAELRASFAGTPLEGRKINNPDQDTVAYVAMHGIPHTKLEAAAQFFKPVGQAREKRNREMTERINSITSSFGIAIDYDADVLPISFKHEGGSVTERHLLFALANKMIAQKGRGKELLDFLRGPLGIEVKGKNLDFLSDENNSIYAYDLLNVLKGNMVEKFYIPATDEAIDVRDVSAFAKENGIILAYAYLGDVTESVTGDKKAQKFEDDYLEEVMDTIKDLGFNAVTYMPSRNSRGQLDRLRALCDKHSLFQISGEDINQPRQKFVCEAMRDESFSNLYDSAWALIGHELEATKDLYRGMFSSFAEKKFPDLKSRVKYYKEIAMDEYGIKENSNG